MAEVLNTITEILQTAVPGVDLARVFFKNPLEAIGFIGISTETTETSPHTSTKKWGEHLRCFEVWTVIEPSPSGAANRVVITISTDGTDLRLRFLPMGFKWSPISLLTHRFQTAAWCLVVSALEGETSFRTE